MTVMCKDNIRRYFLFELFKEVLYFFASIREKAGLEVLNDNFLFFTFAKNFSAPASASPSLWPLDPTTTQWTSTSSYSERSRKIVPPQPISISSLCAPRHKIFMGRVFFDAKANLSMS